MMGVKVPDDEDCSTLAWRKSGASSDAGECVEVAFSSPQVFIRDSKNRAGAVLEVTSGAWRDLVERIRDGGLTGQ
jgi:hypothetical protein